MCPGLRNRWESVRKIGTGGQDSTAAQVTVEQRWANIKDEHGFSWRWLMQEPVTREESYLPKRPWGITLGKQDTWLFLNSVSSLEPRICKWGLERRGGDDICFSASYIFIKIQVPWAGYSSSALLITNASDGSGPLCSVVWWQGQEGWLMHSNTWAGSSQS